MKATVDPRYWAHSDPLGRAKEHPYANWQLLGEHLLEVSRIASRLAKAAQPANAALRKMAAVAGILHDYGKCRACFQRMLDGEGTGCPHALYGALAVRNLPAVAHRRDWAFPVIAAIAAHHAGLKESLGNGTGVLNRYQNRFFGTHWCGPGGGGPTTGANDAACREHDRAYAAAGASAAMNTGGATPTSAQAAAMKAANHALYDAVRRNPAELSTPFLELCVTGGVGYIYTGTQAQPPQSAVF